MYRPVRTIHVLFSLFPYYFSEKNELYNELRFIPQFYGYCFVVAGKSGREIVWSWLEEEKRTRNDSKLPNRLNADEERRGSCTGRIGSRQMDGWMMMRFAAMHCARYAENRKRYGKGLTKDEQIGKVTRQLVYKNALLHNKGTIRSLYASKKFFRQKENYRGDSRTNKIIVIT